MISLTKHPTNDFGAIDRNRVLINAYPPKRKTMSNLPEAYTSIQPYMETESRKGLFQLGVLLTNRNQMSSLKT